MKIKQGKTNRGEQESSHIPTSKKLLAPGWMAAERQGYQNGLYALLKEKQKKEEETAAEALLLKQKQQKRNSSKFPDIKRMLMYRPWYLRL